MAKTQRISLTIATDVLDDLDYLCNRLSVSRSSLVSECLRPGLGNVRKIVDFALPGADTCGARPKSRNSAELRAFLVGLMGSEIALFGQQLDMLSGVDDEDAH